MNAPEDDVDFVTMHNILYYLYVRCVNLPFPWKEKLPVPADPKRTPSSSAKVQEVPYLGP